MEFMTDCTAVKFTGLDRTFSVCSTFVEFDLPIVGTHVSIKFYGMIIAFGFLLAVLLGGRLAYRWRLDLNKMLDVLLYGTIGGIVGARLYYVIFKWDYFRDNLSEIPKIWMGGIAIYGGLIGAVLVAFIVCKLNKLDFLKLLDLAGMGFLIGQGIGRWGNFANQEAFGTNTKLPWGMSSPKITEYISLYRDELAAKGMEMDPNLPVHPTFLYESLWCLCGFLVIYLICKKYYKFSGQLILSYGVIYGAERAVVEGLRTDSLYIGSTHLRVSQLVSIVIVLVCAVLLTVKFAKLKKCPVPYSPVENVPEKPKKPAGQRKRERRERRANARAAKENMLRRQRERQAEAPEKGKGKNDGSNT